MHGDRHFADDLSIVGGLARFNGTPCMVIGQQKGRGTKERALRNFGMSKPEGYRKALRLMKTAEKFKLPVFTFVDTPGAYPGIDAEERGQSEAIGRNIFEMAQLEVPIITTHHRRGRLRRRAGDLGRRPGADAAVFDLFGDQPRRLRVDPVEDLGQGAGRRRRAWASPRTGSRRWA